MRRPLPKLVALCLLLLVVAQPRPHHAPPLPPVQPSSTPQTDWQPVQRAIDLKRWNDTKAWNDAVPKPQSTAKSPVSDTEPAQTEQSQHVAHFDPGSVQQLILDVFGAAGPAALSVAHCESKYDPAAVNGVHVGIFQLSGKYHRARAERLGYSWDQMLEPYPNIVVAHDLFLEQGWVPWECKPR